MTDPTCYQFIAADAARALGMPDHPRLHMLSVCLLIAPNGYVAVGYACPAEDEAFDAGIGAGVAMGNAYRLLHEAASYGVRDHLTLSEPIKTAIRLERSGLPAGRHDVNPSSLPALSEEPLTFAQARSATFEMTMSEDDDQMMVDPALVSEAWDDVRAQIAAADPPFPAHMIGYRVSAEADGETARGTLTVYA